MTANRPILRPRPSGAMPFSSGSGGPIAVTSECGTTATRHVHECPLLQARIFDYNYFRWETTYFLDRFVVGARKLEIAKRAAVDEALHRLAQQVDAFPKGVIHRDFQCQNIMIHAGA